MSCIKSIHLCLWNISFNSKHPYSQPEATTDLLFVITNYVGRFWRRQWHTTPVLLPGKSHGQRSLVGCSPWGRTELDTTEWLHFRFSLSCIGEGNGNPLQCSCLENPRDGGAWWAAVYGVTQSWTWLKRLSSSSNHSSILGLPFWLNWWRIHLQWGRPEFDSWVEKIPWRRDRLHTPAFWLGEFHGLYSTWGCQQSDTTEWLSLFTRIIRRKNPKNVTCGHDS